MVMVVEVVGGGERCEGWFGGQGVDHWVRVVVLGSGGDRDVNVREGRRETPCSRLGLWGSRTEPNGEVIVIEAHLVEGGRVRDLVKEFAALLVEVAVSGADPVAAVAKVCRIHHGDFLVGNALCCCHYHLVWICI